MRCVLCAFLLSVTCQTAYALTIDDTAHLLGRTGFGLSSAHWADYENFNREQAVDFLISQQRSASTTPEPEFVGTDVYQRMFSGELSKAEKQALKKASVRKHRSQLVRWWWAEMLATKSTLNERMVLFWHGHFTSDVRKTHVPFIYQQNLTFRKHGLGDFKVLLQEVIEGPAMQLFLDNNKNRKGKPNENLGRELLELFTLGLGHYSETDVREVARALTGWKVNKDRTTMLFRKKHHDSKSKTILQHTGTWALQDVLNILLESPRTAQFITEKLWREFVSASPDKREVKRIAEKFRSSGYSIEVLVKALLKSDAFWASENRSALVKSPVELAVGTMRDYAIPHNRLNPIIKRVGGSGQTLFFPPDVKGWRGHTDWLSTDKIVQRQAMLQKMLVWKRLEYKANAKKLSPEVERAIDRDQHYYEGLLKVSRNNKRINTISQLKEILNNDFYQFK